MTSKTGSPCRKDLPDHPAALRHIVCDIAPTESLAFLLRFHQPHFPIDHCFIGVDDLWLAIDQLNQHPFPARSMEADFPPPTRQSGHLGLCPVDQMPDNRPHSVRRLHKTVSIPIQCSYVKAGTRIRTVSSVLSSTKSASRRLSSRGIKPSQRISIWIGLSYP